MSSSRPFLKTFKNNKWEPSKYNWNSLSGKVLHEPQAVGTDKALYIVVRGKSSRAFLKRYNRSVPQTNWEKVNDTIIEGRPTLISTLTSGLHLFARGEDDSPLHIQYENGRYDSSRSWYNLGGKVISDIYGIRDSRDDHVHIFARGISGKVFHKWFEGTSWNPGPKDWEDLGGQVMGPVSVSQFQNGEFLLLVTGRSSRGFQNRFDLTKNKWTGWENIG